MPIGEAGSNIFKQSMVGGFKDNTGGLKEINIHSNSKQYYDRMGQHENPKFCLGILLPVMLVIFLLPLLVRSLYTISCFNLISDDTFEKEVVIKPGVMAL